MSELVPYNTPLTGGGIRKNRAALRRIEEVVSEVRMAGVKTDGAIALAAHVMEGVRDLDDERRVLAAGDPVTNQVLAEIELEAVRQVKKIQGALFDVWSI